MSPRPLSSRPLDLLYVIFFIIHIPSTLLVDLQALYPTHLIPNVISQLPRLYIDLAGDPLIGGAMGYPGFGGKEQFAWFTTFLKLELFFQVPIFILGIRGLWKDSRSVYIPLLLYGASTSTTLLPCLAVLLRTPITSPEAIAANIVSVTWVQKQLLLASYIPFLILPFLITVDMTLRISKLVGAGIRAQTITKQQ